MSNIRVTYSGLIGLVIGLCTVVTGIIFILIVTRSFTPEELGNWGLIGGLISYVIIIEPMISYWSTREIARDIESGKTAVFSSGIFSIFGILAFLAIEDEASSLGAHADVVPLTGHGRCRLIYFDYILQLVAILNSRRLAAFMRVVHQVSEASLTVRLDWILR